MNESTRVPKTVSDPPAPSAMAPPEAEKTPAHRVLAPKPGTSLAVLSVLAVASIVYLTRALLLPVILAVLFAVVLSPVMRVLKISRLPEPVSAGLIVLSLVALIGFSGYLLSGPAANWVAKAPHGLLQIESKVRKLAMPVEGIRKATEKVEELARVDGGEKPREVTLKGPGLAGQILTGTESFAIGLVATVVLLYFLLASGDLFLRKMVRVFPRLRDKIHAVEVVLEIQREIAHYWLTVACINIGLGAATATAMFFLRMPNPVLWGVTVALLNFIPYLGAATSFTILTFVALLTFDEFGRALLVPAVFLILSSLEGHFITPAILGKRLALNPVIIFVTVMLWAWMWGVLGAFIAVPMLVMLKVCCDHSERLAALGEFLAHD